MLVVAGGQAAVLLAAVDEALDAVAQAVQRPVEGPGPAFVDLPRDRAADAAPPAGAADPPAAVALVPRDPARAPLRPTAPGPLDRPRSRSCSNAVASCCWPGVSTRVSGLPPPSARRWTLVEKPPRLRPSASVSGSPPLPRPRAGAPGSPSRPRNGPSNRPRRPRRPAVGPRRRPAPRPRPAATAGSGCTPSTRGRTAPAGRARAHPCAASTGSRSGPCDGPYWACPSPASRAGVVAGAVPIARSLARLGSAYQKGTARDQPLRTGPRAFFFRPTVRALFPASGRPCATIQPHPDSDQAGR